MSRAALRLTKTTSQLTSGISTPSKLFSVQVAGAHTFKDNEVYLASAVRTPLGGFNGSLASFGACQLGSHAIQHAVSRAGVKPDEVDEVYFGNVVSSDLGQAPARQAAVGAGLPHSVPCTTVNKVCSSGLKTVMLGSQSIQLGHAHVVVAGGTESMTNIPYYLPKARNGLRYGDGQILDGLVKDGLTDAYNKQPMGNCAELCAEEFKFSRADQDNFAEQSYRRAIAAQKSGAFKNEIVPVEIKTKQGTIVVDTDDEPTKVNFDKMRSLPTVFKKNGTVTAANASVLSDGAAAVMLVSGSKARSSNLNVLGRVVAYADAEQHPEKFTTSPSLAIPKALQRAGLSIKDIDLFEINEAFSVVALANQKLLGLDPNRVNIYGGAVSLGHPLGASGCRILVTLLNALKQTNGRYGVAAICNGGGGASAVVVERL